MLNRKTGVTGLATRAIRTSYLATLGAVALTQRETRNLVDDLVERGEEVDRQNRAMLKRLVRRGKKEMREVEREIEARTADVVATTGVMTRDQVELLEYRVERLSEEVDEMVSEAEREARRRERERREKERQEKERREAEARARQEKERAEAQRSKHEVKQAAKDVKDDVKRGAKDVKDEVKQTAKDVKDDVKQAAKDVKTDVQNGAKDAEAAERPAKTGQREEPAAPWRGYDQMRVPEILERLPQLSDEQLEEVRRYEAANANHKGVLDAIDEQLNKRQPFPEYRTLPATEVTRQIATLDIDQVLAVREYEATHANRVSVMRATERRLGELIGIPDYPDLTVRDVVERLPEMSDEDLKKVRRFEENHENRQGVLRAIDRLENDRMPLPNYGGMTVDEVSTQVETLDAEKLQAVREYEASHSNRVTVMRAIDKRFETIEAEKAQAQENGNGKNGVKGGDETPQQG